MSSPCDAVDEPKTWIDDSDSRVLHQPLMTIRDELGGMLCLNLAQAGMDEMAQACKALLESNLLPGTCLIRVMTGDDTFQLRHVSHTPFRLGITHMDAHAREITVSEPVLRQIIRTLDNTGHLRAPLNVPRSSLISYTF